MAIHKLFIDDLKEADFQLIAIHSHLENFRIAYFVNQQLQTRLSKSSKVKICNSFLSISALKGPTPFKYSIGLFNMVE